MTQEEKRKLVLKDLCARSLYGVKTSNGYGTLELSPRTDVIYIVDNGHIPYLRPMSSMTEEEKLEYNKLLANCEERDWSDYNITTLVDSQLIFVIDWLNEHHFDYRGLIPIGLAREAPEGMYNIK